MGGRKKVLEVFELLWQIPLGSLSYLFHAGIRECMRSLLLLRSLKNDRGGQWRLLSAELVERPMALLTILTTAPRWNTHAVIASAGPLPVERSIQVDPAIARSSARSWGLGISTFPRRGLVYRAGSLTQEGAGETETIPLQPGRYLVVLRYYGLLEQPVLPAVHVDGREVLPAMAISPCVNAFYDTLANKTNFFYLALSYYVFIILRYRRWLPESFVERHYLPAGDPENVFYYGVVRRGESLGGTLDPALTVGNDVYCTLYNRASFPVYSAQINAPGFRVAAMESDCTYLVRVRKKTPDAEFQRQWVQVQLT